MAETASPLPPPMAARHIAVTIDRSFDEVNAFLADPANWPSWASGLGKLDPRSDGTWKAIQSDGVMVTVIFSAPNEIGVFDHRVIFSDGRIIEVPLRLLRNNRGCEIVLTLFRQPEMDDARFEKDAEIVRKDLERLCKLQKTKKRLICEKQLKLP